MIGSASKVQFNGNIGHPGIRWAVSERLRVSTMAFSDVLLRYFDVDV